MNNINLIIFVYLINLNKAMSAATSPQMNN